MNTSRDTSARAKQVDPKKNHSEKRSLNPFPAIMTFLREVVAELKKVVTPTKEELVSYSMTVLFFVAVMIAIVFTLDLGLGWLARFVFAGQ